MVPLIHLQLPKNLSLIDYLAALIPLRRYLPVLKNYPNKYIHEPWKAPESVQKTAKCTIGKDYPMPMVNHAEVSKINVERIRQVYQRLSSFRNSNPGAAPEVNGHHHHGGHALLPLDENGGGALLLSAAATGVIVTGPPVDIDVKVGSKLLMEQEDEDAACGSVGAGHLGQHSAGSSLGTNVQLSEHQQHHCETMAIAMSDVG
jgi:hypothetical protein